MNNFKHGLQKAIPLKKQTHDSRRNRQDHPMQLHQAEGYKQALIDLEKEPKEKPKSNEKNT